MTERVSEKGSVSSYNDSRTPAVAAETKTIEATVIECPTMISLLQRLEISGQVDLHSQLKILENDSIFCGI